MQTTAQRLQVPAGFSGWWCTRCAAAAANIPDAIDAAQTKCPKCHHWTAYWIPTGLSDTPPETPATKRAQAGEARALSAGPAYERKRPRAEDAKRLFDHVRNVIDNPELEPDLRKIDEEDAKR